MLEVLKTKFIDQVNLHLGIAHKMADIYSNSGADKEDLLQEMMYQLWKSYPSFKGIGKFSTWMYSVCLNTALTHQRKAGIETVELTDDLIIVDNSKNKEDTAILMQGIKMLSPLNKAIIMLHLENLSYDEIASITGITKSNVSVRIVRIKKELEQLLKKISHE